MNTSILPRMNHIPTPQSEYLRPVNHVFVDFENVHEVDLTVIGNKSVTFTLLLGSRQTKLDVSLVEKLVEHTASVELVRLTSTGKNALDFTLAYYVGRAAGADPTGAFHIVSKDAGYDPLIEHLRSRNIRARRHNDFTTLTFAGLPKLTVLEPTVATPKPKSPTKARLHAPSLDELEIQVLEHLRKPSTTRPRNKKKLVSFLIGYFGKRITEAQALELINYLGHAGHLTVDEKGAVKYQA